MLYLIGGAPGSGKTYLSKHLASLKNAQVVELDLLMPAFNALIPSASHDEKLPVWAAKRHGVPPNSDDYLVEQETYWPAIHGLLNTLIRKQDNENYIIEGSQLSPTKLKEWLTGLPEQSRLTVLVVFLEAAEKNNVWQKLAIENNIKVISREAALSYLS